MVLPRAFALLRLLAGEQQGLTLSVIAAHLEMPKSSLSSTLKALTDQKMLKRTGALYFLGPEAYSLASVILGGSGIRQIARPFLEKTMDACGETVLLAVLDSDMQHFTYIDIVESQNSVRYSVPIGTRRPLYSTCCGRLFLAFQPAASRQTYFDTATLRPLTGKTIVDHGDLMTCVDAIGHAGLSITMGDFSDDAAGFAAPILNAEGDMIAALAIGVPLSRGEREKRKFSDAVIQSARDISKVLGFIPNCINNDP